MNKKIRISANDLAAILAIWAIALIGYKDITSSVRDSYFPHFFGELVMTNQQDFAMPIKDGILYTTLMSLFLFSLYSRFIKSFDEFYSTLMKKFKTEYIIEIILILQYICSVIINKLFNIDTTKFFLLCCIFYIYSSNKFLFSAKLALIPSLLLFMFAFTLHHEKDNYQYPYMISTTLEGLKEIEVLKATKIGTFVVINTKTDTLLININTITRIWPGDAAITTQPANPQ